MQAVRATPTIYLFATETKDLTLAESPHPATGEHLRPKLRETIANHLSPASFDAYKDRRAFSGKWEASASIHYTAAVVLHDRELWMEQFERYGDPDLKHFAQECVELCGDPQLAAEQAIVEAEMNDGSVLSAHCKASKGTPENPLTRAEIEDKFRKGAKDRLAPAAAERVVETLSRLEELKSVRTLMDTLRKQ